MKLFQIFFEIVDFLGLNVMTSVACQLVCMDNTTKIYQGLSFALFLCVRVGVKDVFLVS